LKENYEIDIHKNKILIYLHNVQYNPDIIKSAVEIIDTLDTFIKQNDSEDHIISNSDLNEINLEFKRFLQERQECIQYIQDSHKKMTSMLQKLNLNFLEKYLSTKFAYVQNSNFVCENCNKSWPTKRALSSHQKACKNKMDESENTICIQTFTN
jgi:rRNA maturation endonuclease Nob1